ncbi:MAG: murein L,D-transpeptidase catalytic domain family protein [Novosphingobium sp.]
MPDTHGIGAPLPSSPATALPQPAAPAGIRPALYASAISALQRHSGRMIRDRVAIVDFAAPSSEPRFHIVDIASGNARSFLVAHGSGSDPDHSGWLERFSNQPGSNASSEGAFLTGDYYYGKHGRSQKLYGLDQSNSNALMRAIVVHGAWYAEAGVLSAHGKLGRSQGCFAFGDSQINNVFGQLGTGRMIYAAKLQSPVGPIIPPPG